MAKDKIIDLFSGAGGFTLGAVQAGFDVALCIDKDKDLTSSHEVNFPNIPLENGDLTHLSPKEILKLAGIKKNETIIGIIGGPPCQGFSSIGKREPSDSRNTLVERFFDYVTALRPSFFVMENVPGILKKYGKKHLERGLNCLPSDYEYLEPDILRADMYGLPTSRRRVFVIGYLPKEVDSLSWTDFKPSKPRNITVYNAIHDLPSLVSGEMDGKYYWAAYDKKPDGGPAGEYARRARQEPQDGLSTGVIREKLSDNKVSGFVETNHTDRVIKRFSNVDPGSRDDVSKCPRLAWDDQCGTLRAGTGRDRGSYQSIRPIHPDEDRVISIREGARIQGFPDWFQFHPTKWHSFRMIGNSVPPLLAKEILSTIRGSLR